MYRFIDDYLDQWVESANRKPLILRGARQTGKTYAVRKLAERKFAYLLEVNLERHPELETVFRSRDPKRILTELSAYFSVPAEAGKTLVFFDEIQNAPEALASLWHFREELPEYHVIAAGSLLDFALNELKFSMPVGRVEFAYMYPMHFAEFLIATGEKGLADYLPQFRVGQPFPAALHQKLLALLRPYFFIGGMPEAVKVFTEGGQLNEVEKVHESILTALEYDFAKYGTRKQQELLRETMHYIARNPGKEITYAKINPHEHSRTIKSVLFKLEMSRLIHLVRKTSAAGVPLENFVDNDKFKAVFLDIGLANHLNGIRLSDLNDLITAYEGGLAEQFAGQEMAATWNPPYMDTKLYYWKRDAKNANAEIDYVMPLGRRIIPVEIKAGKAGKLKSLHVFLGQYRLGFGVRLYTGEPRLDKNLYAKIRIKDDMKELTYDLLSLPLYLTFSLKGILGKMEE